MNTARQTVNPNATTQGKHLQKKLLLGLAPTTERNHHLKAIHWRNFSVGLSSTPLLAAKKTETSTTVQTSGQCGYAPPGKAAPAYTRRTTIPGSAFSPTGRPAPASWPPRLERVSPLAKLPRGQPSHGRDSRPQPRVMTEDTRNRD
jgi:hypothetical protein